MLLGEYSGWNNIGRFGRSWFWFFSGMSCSCGFMTCPDNGCAGPFQSQNGRSPSPVAPN
jgi:hypothetical protein